MAWWIWAIFGLLLLGVEVLTPGGFYALFFAAGALIVALLGGLHLSGPPWVQWFLFSLLSIVSLLLFRKRMLSWLERSEPQTEAIDTLVGEYAVLSADLPPGEIGKAELRGTVWSVRNDGAQLLHKGQRCRVQGVSGLTLVVHIA
ncbi:MAG: NfeD family protein [Candidatus Binatia bacterium]